MKSLNEYLSVNEVKKQFTVSNLPNSLRREIDPELIKDWVEIFNNYAGMRDENDIVRLLYDEGCQVWERVIKAINKAKLHQDECIEYFNEAIDLEFETLGLLLEPNAINDLLDDIIIQFISY